MSEAFGGFCNGYGRIRLPDMTLHRGIIRITTLRMDWGNFCNSDDGLIRSGIVGVNFQLDIASHISFYMTWVG